MSRPLLAAALLAAALPTAAFAREQPGKIAKRIADEVRKINEAHVQSEVRKRTARKKAKDGWARDLPDMEGTTIESSLYADLSEFALMDVATLVRAKDSKRTRAALVVAGEAALGLDWMLAFDRIEERLYDLDADAAKELGIAVSRERFLLRGVGGIEFDLLNTFADALDAVLDQYEETFGFTEWSKVPGKKLRVRLRLVDSITRGPHFAPQFPFHSEIDFPVVDPKRFTSPTSDGNFLFYGLCHELGHVIAMWGDREHEEDRHAWAHYTGAVILEELAKSKSNEKWRLRVRDARYRSLSKDRKKLEGAGVEPSLTSRSGVLALLIKLHDAVGPRAIGTAINHLDRMDERLRIRGVRYYTFAELRAGLLATLDDAEKKRAATELLP